MADPTKYVPGYSFTDYQEANPASPLPADEIDTELANLKTASSQAVDAIKDVRRSDGQLKNLIVTWDSLSSNVKARMTLAGFDEENLVAATGGLTERTLSDHFGDVLSVKDFGAVGDDNTDDYESLQAAADALTDGSMWFVPPGIYQTSQTIVIRAHRVTVLCMGRIVPHGDFDDYLVHFTEETPGGDPLLINVGHTNTILRLELDGKWQSRGAKFTSAYCSGKQNIFITRCYGTGLCIDQGYENSWFGVTILLGKERQRFATPSAWSSATAYVPGDRVVYHHAAYNAGTTYGLGALVRSSGISYISRRSGNIGHTPASSPTWWWIVEDTFLECMIAHTNRDPFSANVYTTNNGIVGNRYWKFVLQYEPTLNIENTKADGVVDHQYFYGLDVRDNAQRYQIYIDNNGNSRAVYAIEFHGAQVHAITAGVTAEPRNTGGLADPPFIKNLILGRTVDCKGFGLSCRTAQMDDSASIMYGLNLPGKVSYGFHQNGRLDGEGARSTGVLVGAAQSLVNDQKHFFDPFFVYTGTDSADYVDPYGVIHRDVMTPLRALNVGSYGTALRKSANQSIAHNTDTLLTWETVDSDVLDLFDAGSPTRITCNFRGSIEIIANVVWGGNASSYRLHRISKNGSPSNTLRGFREMRPGSADGNAVNATTGDMPCEVGDYFEVWVKHEAGSSIDIGAVDTWMQARRTS